MQASTDDFHRIRAGMADLPLSARVEPNETIDADRAFFPAGHRGVLDFRKQLVVGNRGMGKSFWTRALVNAEIRQRLSGVYNLQNLSNVEVIIGFNGSEKKAGVAPTPDQINNALKTNVTPEEIWKAVFVRAVNASIFDEDSGTFENELQEIQKNPNRYSDVLTQADDQLVSRGSALLIVFDALERLGQQWADIRALTQALLVRSVGLQSFQAIRSKIFMRVDQFADTQLFQFRDSSKIQNDSVDLKWKPEELYFLLIFEILRKPEAGAALRNLANQTGNVEALPVDGSARPNGATYLNQLVNLLAGEFMGKNKKRGRVFTWVPLHLSDAASNCSPRTFLTAWQSAASHNPPPENKAVDHLGLIDGVRLASRTRMQELREDYPWIQQALQTLWRTFVPIPKDELFELWRSKNVVTEIIELAKSQNWLEPIDLASQASEESLLAAMVRIAVMEERANGKINVPDIFRVEAEILRKGGVAVPRRR